MKISELEKDLRKARKNLEMWRINIMIKHIKNRIRINKLTKNLFINNNIEGKIILPQKNSNGAQWVHIELKNKDGDKVLIYPNALNIEEKDLILRITLENIKIVNPDGTERDFKWEKR